VKAGRLHPLYRGVYAVGHPNVGRLGWWQAAVFASGPDALLSYRTAAALWGLRPTARTQIDITTAVRKGGRIAGIARHHGRVHPEDRALEDNIPVTSVPRTLLDLAEVLQPQQLARAIEEAERRRLFDLAAVQRVVARGRGRRGLGLLVSLLSDYSEPPFTRSDVEGVFFALCRDGGVPLPAMNVIVEGEEVDALFASQRVVVEIDGRGFHMTTAAFERDRRRDAKLMLAGYRVLRITYRQLMDDPRTVLETLRALIDRG
jgi:hypothetical protein